jgi:hypothetical protein
VKCQSLGNAAADLLLIPGMEPGTVWVVRSVGACSAEIIDRIKMCTSAPVAATFLGESAKPMEPLFD